MRIILTRADFRALVAGWEVNMKQSTYLGYYSSLPPRDEPMTIILADVDWEEMVQDVRLARVGSRYPKPLAWLNSTEEEKPRV